MRVISTDNEGGYLLSQNNDLDAALKDGSAQGRVLMTEGRVVLMPSFSLHSVLSGGGWQECRMTTEETDALLVRYGLPPANDGQELPNTRIRPRVAVAA